MPEKVYPEWYFNEDTGIGEIEFEPRKGLVMSGHAAHSFNIIMVNTDDQSTRRRKMMETVHNARRPMPQNSPPDQA